MQSEELKFQSPFIKVDISFFKVDMSMNVYLQCKRLLLEHWIIENQYWYLFTWKKRRNMSACNRNRNALDESIMCVENVKNQSQCPESIP